MVKKRNIFTKETLFDSKIVSLRCAGGTRKVGQKQYLLKEIYKKSQSSTFVRIVYSVYDLQQIFRIAMKNFFSRG